MSERSWKRTEREIAAILGGHRVPVTGRARGDVPDVAHRWLSIEVKSRRALPAWLLEAVAQARAAATEYQLPVAILHQEGSRHGLDLVVMRLSDFEDWFGGIDHGKEANTD